MTDYIKLSPRNPINYLNIEQINKLVKSSSAFILLCKDGNIHIKKEYSTVFTKIARKIKNYKGNDLNKNWGSFEKLIKNVKKR